MEDKYDEKKFNIDKKIETLENALNNLQKNGETGSLLSLTPIAFNFLFAIALFLLKRGKTRVNIEKRVDEIEKILRNLSIELNEHINR